MKYSGKKTREIIFPLGGIGSGSIGLAGNGGLTDIEIANRPNKGSTAQFTHFAVKAENASSVLDARVLQADLQPGYVGSFERPKYSGYGFGPDRGSMAGFPHFAQADFEAEFPQARMRFTHHKFPGEVEMRAFNPFIPSNEDDSSLPAAFFSFTVTNTSGQDLCYTVALSCNNYYAGTDARHSFGNTGGAAHIFLDSGIDPDDAGYGNLCIATDCPCASYQEFWYRGNWFDNVNVFWQEFTRHGTLKNRSYREARHSINTYADLDVATLAAHAEVKAGQTREFRFVLSWSMPWMQNTWEMTNLALNEQEVAARRAVKWKNHYATRFETSMESALYALENFDRLDDASALFSRLIHRSSLPAAALDAVVANLAVLKSPTCLRLEDGSFYGFEGVHPHEGSCEGTCTHVWSYAYAPAFLFPRLERSARTLEYTESMQADGGMGFRLQLPLGFGPTSHRPCVDGQYGTVMRVYREFMVSGDVDWLRAIWPQVKRTVEYAWSEKNPDRWDADRDGVMEGRQHHTLDMELFGPNSWLTGMYLGGLAAAARLARVLGEENVAEEYLAVFRSGAEKLNRELNNGEYYCQRIDLEDRSELAQYTAGTSAFAADPVVSYWNEESGEVKYQVGEGCSIDQALGQWHADLLGLGQIFDEEKLRSALGALYRYNYVPEMREHVNPCRIYALNDEKGTLICAWPPHVRRPHIPVPYAEETMHGFEYAAAGQMILHGMEEEGLACIRAVRERYDGERRNPWNEMECGSNYARSMASYSLLLIYSGFSFDMHRRMVGFAPRVAGPCRFFWSLEGGFGEVAFGDGGETLTVAYGQLPLRRLRLREPAQAKELCLNGCPVAFEMDGEELVLQSEALLATGDRLEILR